MARNPSQIRDSLAATVHATDPSADVDKGPIYDFLIAPVASELAETESQVELLRQLTSLQLPEVATSAELNAIGTNFGIATLSGKSSKVRQTFFSFSAPAFDVVIPRGVLVGTSDGSLLFRTDEQVTLPVSQAALFFVPSRRRYEITARVIATAAGPNFDLPSFRINRMFTTISGIDGTENRESSSGGVLQQAAGDYFTRIQQKFAGLNSETGGGIISSIYELNPDSVTDVILAFPKDRGIFYRDISRPAIDAYITGTIQTQASQIYTAIGGETTITLDNVPVLSVDSVTKNSITLTDFAFLPDSSFSNRRSARAVDKVVLSAPLAANDSVTVAYTYNQLISDSQSVLFNDTSRLFDTDILARMPIDVFVTIDINVNVLLSFDPAQVSDAVTSIVFAYCNAPNFVDILLPDVLRDRIINGVAGVTSVSFNKFTRSSGSNVPVETISFQKNEISVVDQSVFNVRVKQ